MSIRRTPRLVTRAPLVPAVVNRASLLPTVRPILNRQSKMEELSKKMKWLLFLPRARSLLSSMHAPQAITGAIPKEHKGGIREQLRPVGFSGYLVNELTPNRTRRAQVSRVRSDDPMICFSALWDVLA